MGRGGSAHIVALILQAVATATHSLHAMSVGERIWKYAALAASSIVFEEANPLIGGIAVRHGRASLAAVIASIAIGIWIASLLLYAIGYWRVDWVRARWPKKERLLDAALQIVRRHPWRAALAIRFAYWLRIPLPIACGAARVPFSLFLIASGISCWLWSTLFALLGFWMGRRALILLSFARRLDVRLALIAALLLAALFILARRRRLAERTARVLTGEHIPIMTTAERMTPAWPMRQQD